MPEINAVLTTQELETTIEEQTGSLNVQLEDVTGAISGIVESNEGELTGVVNSDSEILTASLNIKSLIPNASLDVHYGIDGKPGKDGFSPIISVYKNTKKEYILEITNKNGSYLTPNLKPDIDIILDVSHKVDKDLTLYDNYDPLILNKDRRAETLLYVYDKKSKRSLNIKGSDIALQKEVDEQIKRKIQTVTAHPDNWTIGDYIFLEKQEESD